MTISPNQPGSGARGESRLRRRIADEIRRHGPMPFSRYMQMCLYEPELGYYSRLREQFGKAGDFYTSSDVHAVFGRLLARQFEEMWRALDSPERIDVIELGPGRGLFARDVLDWSAKQFPEFARALRYALVEQSAHLRDRLQERLAEHLAAERARVFASLETAASRAGENIIVFGNEFFDALPVEVVDYRGGLRIGVENGKFVETFVRPSAAEAEFLDRYSVHPEAGERVEAAPMSLEWMERIAEVFRGKRGFLVAIDYGYTREEQLAGRHRDTVMSYRQHTVSASPYEAPGEQDITAHVNFTAIRERGVQRGLEPVALLTQSQFLIGIGEETEFADAFQECELPQERAKVALQLKHLISPTGMGETFQVLLMSAGVAKEKAAGLSGLKLGRI
ncbi:MAG: class I SAM-dependent methyltransferase [Terriglobales bacterium]